MSIDLRGTHIHQLSINSETSLKRAPPLDDSLERCLGEFDSFLSVHGDRIAEIRRRLAAPQAPSVLNVYDEYNPYSNSSGTLNSEARAGADAVDSRELDDHSQNLALFIEDHLANLHRLRCSLQGQDPYKPGVVELHEPLAAIQSQSRSEEQARTEMKELSQQFSIIVLFSTFTAGLIIAYMQLMQATLPPPDPVENPKAATHWYMGFGFGFTGLIWNIAIAIVAGADTAACASGLPWKSLDAIRGRFLAFAIAQFIGAGIFGGCIGLLLFPFHSGRIMIALPMFIFPLALLRAGTDLASMSKEFRAMKAEFKAWFCGCCYRR
ncbi:hypothetical protein BDN72DRAFT_847980 [Pluteus cervinus]|uniref:Uncharacterized protein n=1 Tax=Pluteus cervinus TaxID=181527 RepID=A0ACD3ABN6_9AGAR|nr:hypothetical protein BDN72DRAFT_847980 [Pluteus cervinus]